MRVFRTILTIGLLLIGGGASFVSATEEGAAPKLHIRVVGRASSVVTGDGIRLEDIAEVSSPSSADDESVIALKKIGLGASPSPGKSVTIQGATVVDRLKAAQVDLKQVGYTFPREMSVTRAGRVVTPEEIRAAIDAVLAVQKREVTVKGLRYDESEQVLPGVSTVLAQELFSQTPGQIPFMITVKVPGAQDSRFRVVATAEEWKEVPVATRSLARGAIVDSGDVAMARLNTGAIPRDAADQPGMIVGLATSSAINFGEVFQRGKLAIPPMVPVGAKVTLIVKTALFEATASGIALEPGTEGQDIRVRNDSSKKIVIGKISSPSTVIVTPVGEHHE